MLYNQKPTIYRKPEMLENRSHKICIMGASTSTNNRGVSALAVSLVKILLSLEPTARLSFITGSRDSQPQKISLIDKELLLPTVGYRLSPKAPFHQHLFIIFILALVQRFIPSKRLRRKLIYSNPVLREMYEADFVADIQGGDSFSDIYGLPGFVIGVLPMFIVILLQKKLVLLPQTYGPYKNVFARTLAHLIMKHAHFCFSRDKEGVDQLRKIKKGATNFSFCPDVAFMLDPIKPSKTIIIPKLPDSSEPLVGININGLMYNGGYTRKNMFGLAVDYKSLILEIVKLMIDQNSRVLLIPHTYGAAGNANSDPLACEEVYRQIGSSSVHILKGEYNQSEIKNIIGTCGFFIGSRMHACIAALSQGVPTVGVAYSKKFIGVFESVNAGEMVVDCRMIGSEEIKSVIMKFFSGRSELLSNNIKRLNLIRTHIINSMDAVFKPEFYAKTNYGLIDNSERIILVR